MGDCLRSAITKMIAEGSNSALKFSNNRKHKQMKNRLRSIGAALLIMAAMACMTVAIQPQTAKAQETGHNGAEHLYGWDERANNWEGGYIYVGSHYWINDTPVTYYTYDYSIEDAAGILHTAYNAGEPTYLNNTSGSGGCSIGMMPVPCRLLF